MRNCDCIFYKPLNGLKGCVALNRLYGNRDNCTKGTQQCPFYKSDLEYELKIMPDNRIPGYPNPHLEAVRRER